jgi:Icc-related predicted phosphoesterase
MEVTAIADMHGAWNKLKLGSGDLLIIAGDLVIWEEKDLDVFNKWLDAQDFTFKMVVGGNHDRALATKKFLCNAVRAIYLNNRPTALNDFTFWGSPITPKFLNWYFMAEPAEIQNYWNMIPPDTDVVITHGPPYGILDVNRHGQHCGCPKLL